MAIGNQSHGSEMTLLSYLFIFFPPTRWLIERAACWACLLVMKGQYR